MSDGTVVLAWDAVEDATGYNVLRQGPGETAHTQLAAPTTNAYTDVAVSGGSSYSYQVQAVDDDGVGSLTDAVTADVPAPPDAPTNVQATATDSSVTLTWTAPGETLAGYFVYRKVRNADPPEDFTFHNAADAVDTTYTDATVEADTAYAYYIVAARSALELSEPSATVEVDTPAESPLTGVHAGGRIEPERAGNADRRRQRGTGRPRRRQLRHPRQPRRRRDGGQRQAGAYGG